MRCIACNKPLVGGGAVTKNPATEDYEDMCSTCRRASKSEFNYVYDHEYIQPVGNDVPEKRKSSYFYDFFDN